jgi:type VII secretion integral membrane protein EccD
MTVSNLCRVTVQTHCGNRSSAADLVLPNGIELGEVLPDVVDIVSGDVETDIVVQRWVVSRLDGSVLDDSKTLHENGVCDGDMLILTTTDTRPVVAEAHDLCHAAVDSSGSRHDGRLTQRMSAVACLWATGVGAVALACSGHSAVFNRAVIAAILAAAATAGSIVAARVAPEPLPALALGITAASFAAVAGFLAVPGGPAPPNFLLAAVVCVAVSIALRHFASPGGTCFTAIAAFSATAAITAAIVTIWPAPAATAGAVLAAASLALLSAASKLSIVLTGLSPTMPGTAQEAGNDMPASVCVARAENGHRTLTGLLAGFSATAALGAVLVTVDHLRDSALSGIGLTAVVAVALLLRARQQLGALRPIAVCSAGIASATATFILVIGRVPQHAQWICLSAAVLGVGVLWLTVASPCTRFSPVMRRSVELVEYVALGLVVPMACWVGDVFGFVRGLSLR